MIQNSETAASRGAMRVSVEAVIAATGILFLMGALWANQDWWDRHFLPVFFLSHEKYLQGERLARLASAVIGAVLIAIARPAGRMAERTPARELAAGLGRIILAVALALAVCELMMGHKFAFAAAETANEEPLRQPDARLGWIFRPAREGRMVVGEREIAYAIDPHGYRVRGPGAPVNVDLPSVVFTGESIIAGYGLNWDETIPAQVGALLGTQSASIAVFGYANDQAYLRLASELPRFRRPLAVVSLFIPSLFARDLGDDRPYLGPGLRWQPAVHRWWFSALLRFLVPYHGETEIEQGIQATRAELIATTALARQKGAIALVVDPQYGAETPVERMLRRCVLDEPRIAYVRVPLDPSWHLKGDLHPDPRAAHAIAMAIAARLRGALAGQNGRHGLEGALTR